MNISDPLFIAENICLGPIDHEKDPPIEAAWMQDAWFLRMIRQEPAMPETIAQIKKRYEAIEKEQDEKGNLYYFTIRMRQDDRLIGFAKIKWIDWSNGGAFIELGIGDSQDRRRGFGSETLRLMLRFAFGELNLYRLAGITPEFNTGGLGMLKKFGFMEEVRRRQAVSFQLQRWDMIHLGLLKDEWAIHAENSFRGQAQDISHTPD
jgi:RimJ/RimL family protein N-acetyltransferase